MKRIPKLLAFDLDGTLAESKQRLSAQMAERLTALLAKMPVAIMSGADFTQFERQFLSAFEDTASFSRLYIFPDNAAQCYLWVNGSWHPQYDHHFSEHERKKIMEVLTAALAEVGLSTPSEQVWGERIEDRGAQISFSPLGQDAPVDAKEAWHETHDALRMKLREILASRLQEFSVAAGGMTTIDITRKGINKSYGIHRLVELTHVPIADMLYVGDALDEGGNDAVVMESGVPTHAVFGPEETAALIDRILAEKHAG